MGQDYDTKSSGKTITPAWRVPLYVVGGIVSLAIYGTIGYQNIMSKLDAAVTQPQVQEWIDNAREQNKDRAPFVEWPRLPEKKSSSNAAVPEAIVARKD